MIRIVAVVIDDEVNGEPISLTWDSVEHYVKTVLGAHSHVVKAVLHPHEFEEMPSSIRVEVLP
jgi:hypothetical protein